jgi:hypothetical protein
VTRPEPTVAFIGVIKVHSLPGAIGNPQRAQFARPLLHRHRDSRANALMV